jgi:hypothetical protein
MKKSKSRGSGKKGAKKGKSNNGGTNTFVQAAIELSRAVDSFRESLEHMSKARDKGEKMMKPIQRAGAKAMRTMKKTVARARK